MSEMVERVARAMWKVRDDSSAVIDAILSPDACLHRPSWEDQSEIYKELARVAIAELRDTSDEMCVAGMKAINKFFAGEKATRFPSDIVWERMIDAALKPDAELISERT